MKKIIGLAAMLIVFSFSTFSQNNNQYNADNEYAYFPKYEIRLNLLTSVFGIPEINYEYFVQDNFGLGLALQASVEDFTKTSYRAGVIPYGRLYFGQVSNSGFFIEGSAGLVFEKYIETYWIQEQSTVLTKDETNFGIGVALGYKFLTKNDWVGDVSLGAGRIFGHTNFGAYPRFGISIGKRF